MPARVALSKPNDSARKGCVVDRYKRILTTGTVVVATVAIGYLLIRLRSTNSLANATVDRFEAELRALDPVARAEVVARLSSDAVTQVKAMI